jgi:DNA (cytosine-5)-methyltransferase 1
MKYNYNWTLKDAAFTKDKGKAFSCFGAGGGGTMGLKLAGFNVIGVNEIDPKVMSCYIMNHKPRYIYAEPIQRFKTNDYFPPELYELDILEGSAPCSGFSYCGNRSDDWGKEKRYREGQAEQVLETLIFDLIDVAEILKPKVVISENVKGILAGDAKNYVIKMYEKFAAAGYILQHFLLEASKMGVPQKRERVFFIALRADLANPFLKQVDMFNLVPELKLEFDGAPILYSDIADDFGSELTTHQRQLWNKRIGTDANLCDINKREHDKISGFNARLVRRDEVLPTVAGEANLIEYDRPYHVSDAAIIKAQTFPSDYNFMDRRVEYVCGISVPPVMMARVVDCIYEQWLSKIK